MAGDRLMSKPQDGFVGIAREFFCGQEYANDGFKALLNHHRIGLLRQRVAMHVRQSRQLRKQKAHPRAHPVGRNEVILADVCQKSRQHQRLQNAR